MCIFMWGMNVKLSNINDNFVYLIDLLLSDSVWLKELMRCLQSKRKKGDCYRYDFTWFDFTRVRIQLVQLYSGTTSPASSRTCTNAYKRALHHYNEGNGDDHVDLIANIIDFACFTELRCCFSIVAHKYNLL